MEWLKKTAGKVKRPHSASGGAETDRPAPHRVQTGKFNSHDDWQHGSACCSLGGRTDGSFGDSETAWTLKRLWKQYADFVREQELDEASSASPPSTSSSVRENAALKQRDGLDEADRLLLCYLRTFNDIFGAVRFADEANPQCPELLLLRPGSQRPVTPQAPSQVSFGGGHPHSAVVGICNRVPLILDHLHECAAITEASPASGSQHELVAAFLIHLEILARNERNREAMIRHDFAQSAAGMLQVAADAIILSEQTVNNQAMQSVQLLLAVFRQCADPDKEWACFVQSRGRRGQGPQPTGEPTDLFRNRPARNPLPHNALRTILLSALQLQSHLRSQYTIAAFALRIQAINLVASLCVNQASSVCTILQDVPQGFDMLLNLMGSPLPGGTDLCAPASPSHQTDFPSMFAIEYKCQMLTLFAVKYLCIRNPVVSDELNSNTAWRGNVSAFLKWTAGLAASSPTFDVRPLSDDADDFVEIVRISEYTPDDSLDIIASVCDSPKIWIQGNDRPDIPISTRYPPPSASPLHSPLDYLMAVLESFCLTDCSGWWKGSSHDLSSSPAKGFGSPSDHSHVSPTNVSEGTVCSSIGFALKVFTDELTQAGDAHHFGLKMSHPVLQYAFLRLLSRLFIESPDDDEDVLAMRRRCLLKQMDEADVWATLIGTRFYLWKPPASAKADNSAAVRLRHKVVHIISYCATLAASNDRPYHALLSLLGTHYASSDKQLQHDVVINTCGSLCFILRTQKGPAQQALHRLRAFGTLIPIISHFTGGLNDEAQTTTEIDASLLHPVIALLQSMLTGNSEMAIYAFTNPECMNVLFILLANTADIRVSEFAKMQILETARVLVADYPVYGCGGANGDGILTSPTPRTPVAPNATPMTPPAFDQETAPDLLKRFFECFPADITRREQAELQIRLLDGIKNVLLRPPSLPSSSNPPSSSAHSPPPIAGTVKDALIKANGLQFILSVLSVKINVSDNADEYDAERIARSLAECAIDTLGVLLADDDGNKRVFRLMRGYDELLTRICVKPARPAWDGLLDAVFRLTADGKQKSEPKVEGSIPPPRIRNGDAIDLLIHLYAHCPSPQRSTLISRLGDMATANEANKAILHNFGAFSLIMKLVLPVAASDNIDTNSDPKHLADIMRVLTAIAGYSLTVAEVKLVLQCLCRRNIAYDTSSVMEGGTWSAAIGRTSLSSSSRRTSVTSDTTSVTATTTTAVHLEDDSKAVSTVQELPLWYDALIHTVLEIAHKQDGDLDFFALDGESGMSVQPIPRFPTGNNGWSFATWIRIAAPPATTTTTHGIDNSRDIQYLLSFSTASGDQQCDFYIRNRVLCVTIIRNGKPHVATAHDCTLQYGKWHSVVVSHSHPKLPWATSSECSLYVDGVQRWKGKLEYPESTQYPLAQLGAPAVPHTRKHHQHQQQQPGTTFMGQITSLYLFDDIIPSHTVAQIFAAGPARASHLGRGLGERTEDANASGPTTPTGFSPSPSTSSSQSDFMNRIALELHPLATTGNALPSSNASAPAPSSVVTCGTKCFQTALHALGGIGILIPILAQVDLSGGALAHHQHDANTVDSEPGAELGSDISSNINHAAETTMIRKLRTASFFELLACVTAKDSTHRNVFYEMKGPKLVAALLQMNDHAALGVEVFQSLTKFLEAVASHPDLSNAVQENLIFEVRIWATTPAYVQKEYLLFVEELVASNRVVYSKRFRAAFWIDVLERWYRRSNGTPSTTAAELADLRGLLMDIIRAFLQHAPTASDLERLLRTLTVSPPDDAGENEDGHVAECLRLVLELGTAPNGGSKFLERLLHHGAAHVLLHLLRDNNAGSGKDTRRVVPVLALHCIAAILMADKVPDKWKRRLQLVELNWFNKISTHTAAAGTTNATVGSSTTTTLLSLPGATSTPLPVNSSTQPPGPIVFSRILADAPFTPDIYHALLQLAIEEQVVNWQTLELIVAPVDMRAAKVKNPAFFGTILQLLLSLGCSESAGPDTAQHQQQQVPNSLKCRVIHDLLVLASRNENGDRIRKAVRWQPAFLRFLPPASIVGAGAPSAPIPAADDDADATRLSNLVFEALTTFTLDTFEKDRKAWRCVQDTAIYIYVLFNETQVDRVLRTFLERLLHTIRGELAGGDPRSISGAKMENIVHVLLFVEEYMFHHHSLRDILAHDLRSQDVKRFAFLGSHADLVGSALLRNNSFSDESHVQISFPLGECRSLAEECLELLTCLLDLGVTNVRLDDGAEKSHVRTGGLVRLAIRILLSGLAVPEEETWHLTLRHLIPLLDKHAATFSESKKDRGLYVLGHVHEAYVVAQSGAEHEHPTSNYRVLLPLYMLVVSRWRDNVAALSDGTSSEDPPIVPDILLTEALADQDIFNHLVSSPVWAGVFDNHLFPVMRIVEQEQFAIVPLVTKRFSRAAKTLIAAWCKDEHLVETAKAAIDQALLNASWKRRELQVRARIDWEKETEMDRRCVARDLCALWRTLTQERGIWHPYLPESATTGGVRNVAPPPPPRRWKLDRAENSLRMRRRMAVNWEFDPHDSAAAKRDKTFKPDSTPSRGGSPKLSRTSTSNSISPFERKRLEVEKPRARLDPSVLFPPDVLKGISTVDVAPPDEAEAEEEWNLLNDDDLHGMYSIVGLNGSGVDATQRLLYSSDGEMILLMTPVKGRLELTPTHILFTADIKATTADLCDSERDAVLTLMTDNRAWLKERAWPVSDLTDAYLRRYMLRRSALELFFTDKTSHLFNFPVLSNNGTLKMATKERAKFLKALLACRPPLLNRNIDLRNLPSDLAKRSNMTDRWTRREISNFEYLMWLNTVSGRTYNDLTQYPVFPWVLRDYTSETIDLTDLSIYRDLSKPIGALDDARLQQYLERYNAFDDPTGRIKKFHYGTHYSSAASVLFYLLRLEPFTSLHIGLQSGKFDHPDRQFHAMQSCWKSVSTGAGDVKELIPEFFYMPEFLINENEFDLGTKQTGEVLGDVVLPPWAKTHDEFIRIHREALESDYVSAHLHEWIDLIWGYKQTGDEAIKANNVFYYLTYEGAINIDSIKDPVERRSIEDQINNFGQTPSQLFKKPHPARRPAVSAAANRTLFSSPQNHKSYLIEVKQPAGVLFIAACGGGSAGEDRLRGELSGLSGVQGRLITVDDAMSFRSHRWTGATDDTPFVCDLDQAPLRNRKLPFQLGSSVHPHAQLYAATRDGRYLLAGGSWDCSFRILDLDVSVPQHHTHGHHHHHHHSSAQTPLYPRTVDAVYGHRDVVTCLAISDDDRILVTGSRDTTVMTWDLEFSNAVGSVGGSINSNSSGGSGGAYPIVSRGTRKVFCGHDEGVTDVAINIDHGLVVSGSSDGTVILHTLHDAGYLRTIHPQPSKPDETLSVRRVLVSYTACVVIYSEVIPREHPLPPISISSSTSASASATMDAEYDAQAQQRRGSAPALGNVCYLHAYTINARPLRSRMFPIRLKDVKCAPDGEHLVVADDRGGISLLKTHNFSVLHRFDVSISVTSVSISLDQRYFFLGRKDGRILVLEHDAKATNRS